MSMRESDERDGGEGHRPPNTGKPLQEKGDVSVGTQGSGAASVVLRATLETFGAAGDVELHFTVKWPAAALAEARQTALSLDRTGSGLKSKITHADGAISHNGNLSGPPNAPSGPDSN
jgi:hypothetical protein